MENQKTMILKHLQKFGAIDPMVALRDYGCMRLGARIWDLRHDGHNIKATTVHYKNKFGQAKHYSVYTLEEEKHESA